MSSLHYGDHTDHPTFPVARSLAVPSNTQQTLLKRGHQQLHTRADTVTLSPHIRNDELNETSITRRPHSTTVSRKQPCCNARLSKILLPQKKEQINSNTQWTLRTRRTRCIQRIHLATFSAPHTPDRGFGATAREFKSHKRSKSLTTTPSSHKEHQLTKLLPRDDTTPSPRWKGGSASLASDGSIL